MSRTEDEEIDTARFGLRARKMINRLGFRTWGELAAYTPEMLLEAKNFGLTSLREVEGRLAEVGLALAGRPPVAGGSAPVLPPRLNAALARLKDAVRQGRPCRLRWLEASCVADALERLASLENRGMSEAGTGKEER